MGSHGITATESDSYSASLSQDTGESILAGITVILTPLRRQFILEAKSSKTTKVCGCTMSFSKKRNSQVN